MKIRYNYLTGGQYSHWATKENLKRWGQISGAEHHDFYSGTQNIQQNAAMFSVIHQANTGCPTSAFCLDLIFIFYPSKQNLKIKLFYKISLLPFAKCLKSKFLLFLNSKTTNTHTPSLQTVRPDKTLCSFSSFSFFTSEVFRVPQQSDADVFSTSSQICAATCVPVRLWPQWYWPSTRRKQIQLHLLSDASVGFPGGETAVSSCSPGWRVPVNSHLLLLSSCSGLQV